MTTFGTELEVKPSVSREKFFATVIAWVRGMNKSDLFSDETLDEKDVQFARLVSPSGEEFSLRECKTHTGFVLGARYERPDDDGLTWRSEVVLTNKGEAASIRVRGMCLTRPGSVKPRTPKKPYVLKHILDDGWLLEKPTDELPVIDHVYDAESIGVSRLSELFLGKRTTNLPLIYISAPFDPKDIVPEHKLRSEAIRMAGVAHIVVEKNRDFSKRLMEVSGGINPYGDSIGVVFANQGVLFRMYRGKKFQSREEVLSAVVRKATDLTSSREATLGWDWNDLLEEQARQTSARARRSEAEFQEYVEVEEEYKKAAQEEISALKKQISELQQQTLTASNDDGSVISQDFAAQIAPELYQGEIADRVRFVLNAFVKSNSSDVDPRTLAIINRIIDRTDTSQARMGLINRLKAAGRDSSQADNRIMGILGELGYEKRRSGHTVMSPPENLVGLESQTFSTSPSDHRAGKNKASQVIKSFHLKHLD